MAIPGQHGLVRVCTLELSLSTTMTTSTTDAGADILDVNPYEGHPSLSQLEADVLWEYAKLSHQVKNVRTHIPRLHCSVPLIYSMLLFRLFLYLWYWAG